MAKVLIVVIALSLVLVSGSIFSARADCCLNPCGWHLSSCGCSSVQRDRDRDIDYQTGFPMDYMRGFPTDFYNHRGYPDDLL